MDNGTTSPGGAAASGTASQGASGAQPGSGPGTFPNIAEGATEPPMVTDMGEPTATPIEQPPVPPEISVTEAMGTPTGSLAPAAGGPRFDTAGSSEKLSPFKAQVERIREQARTRALTAAQDGKGRASDALQELGLAAREAALKLSGGQTPPQVARVVDRAADQLQRYASTLRDKDVEELLDDVRDFVRTSPRVAMGLAVALGLVTARFLKASSERPRSGGPAHGYDE